MSHTKGTLKNTEKFILDEDNVVIACCHSALNNEANARRLVACWNACGNIPTEWLESVSEELSVRSFAQTVQERDELVSALRDLERISGIPSMQDDPARAKARKLLSKYPEPQPTKEPK